ncbi:MAG: hypothetical protein ACRDPK_21065 [Carbonactinosporaceae bacterium]
MNAPVTLNDMQFFTHPVIGDVSGDGRAEVIQGSAVSDTVAYGLDDTAATATRWFTGGWHVASAAIGHAPLRGLPPGSPGRGRLSVATVTREGYLRLHPTDVEAGSQAACTALAEWPEYGHDPFNSGNAATDAVAPAPVEGLRVSRPAGPVGAVDLHFTAPGDDRSCGRVDHYAVRAVDSVPDASRWGRGRAVGVASGDLGPGGEAGTLRLGRLPGGAVALLVRAYDEAGNGSAVASVLTVP